MTKIYKCNYCCEIDCKECCEHPEKRYGICLDCGKELGIDEIIASHGDLDDEDNVDATWDNEDYAGEDND